MSQTKAQLHEIEELDARVDALVEGINTSAAAVKQALPASPAPVSNSSADLDADEAPEPLAADPRLTAGAKTPISFDDADFSSAASVLEEVSGEIEIDAPGPIAVKPEEVVAIPAATDAKPTKVDDMIVGIVASEPQTPAVGALDTVLADAAADLIETPAAITDAAPEPATNAAPETKSDPAADPTLVARMDAAANLPPVADIEQLDQALAANADKALEEAQRDLEAQAVQSEQATKAADEQAATAAPAAKPESSPAPSAPAKPAPEAREAAKPAPTPAANHIQHAEPAPAGRGLLAMLLAPLQPLAALHAKLGEQTRQTIGYIAIMNVFFASVVWFFALRTTPDRTAISEPTELHETESAAKHAEGGAEHGAKHEPAKSEHGGAEHAKTEKKSSSAHGESEHGAEKKPPAKPAKKETKKPAKKGEAHAEAHGEH